MKRIKLNAPKVPTENFGDRLILNHFNESIGWQIVNAWGIGYFHNLYSMYGEDYFDVGYSHDVINKRICL